MVAKEISYIQPRFDGRGELNLSIASIMEGLAIVYQVRWLKQEEEVREKR